MPNNENVLKALEVHGPMIMTSLNISGEEPIIKYNDCLKFIDDVDYIVKGKDLSGIPFSINSLFFFLFLYLEVII